MNLSAIGRCIDQPLVLQKLQTKMPALLIGAGTGYGVYDTVKSSKGKDKEFKKQRSVKNAIIISATAAASLIGARGLNLRGKQIIPALMPNPSLKKILQKQNAAIDAFVAESGVKDSKILNILKKARTKAMNPKETAAVMNDIPDSLSKRKLFETILPESENLDSKGIFDEIKRLSFLGVIPVVGGITGGIVADKVTKTHTPNSVSNKIKEGFYQFFANIFLCNVGACAALFSAEGLQKAGLIKPLSSLKKMAVIMAGITATGIIGGSWIANKMSQKIIDPMFNNGKNPAHKRGIYDERKPELTDIALHADDIATAGVLSGFKWIEPALPLMYFVSGYRAGIGYRNNHGEHSH